MITTRSQGLSYIQYIADGIEDNFVLIFPYLYQADIHVYIDGVETTNFTWLNSSEITIGFVPVNSALVHIKRITKRDDRIVDFQDGGVIREKTLDLDSNQLFYISQEALDEASFALIVDNATDTVDAHNTRIINVLDGVDPQDAVTKAQLDVVDAIADAAVVTANAAEATANGIEAYALDALTQAAAAVVTSDAAQVAADAAVVTADAAEATANGIEAFALDAQANAAAAVITADAAAVDAATAITDAATAQAAADASQAAADAAQGDATQALADAATAISDAADAQADATQALVETAANSAAILEANNAYTFLMSTSLLAPVTLLVNADPTKFDIPSFDAVFVNHSNPYAPTRTVVTYAGSTGHSVDNLALAEATYISVNAAGTILQTIDLPSSSQLREYVVIGNLLHQSRTQIDLVYTLTNVTGNAVASSLSDLSNSLGVINRFGNKISGNITSPLKIDKSAGESFQLGISNGVLPNNPNVTVDLATTGMNFFHTWRDGSGGWRTVVTDTISPNTYDNNTASVGSVPNGSLASNKWKLMRVYHIIASNTIVIQDGQRVFNTLDAAVSAKDDTVPINPAAVPLKFRGWFIVRGGASNLQLLSDAEFIDAGKLGGSSGGVSGSSTTTLQGAYNNSTEPEILTSVGNGAVTIQRGSGADTDNVLEIKNGASTITTRITGEGNIVDAGIIDPKRLDVKKGTKSSLDTYATTASNGQLCFATDDKKMFQVVDGLLKAVGGGGDSSNILVNGDFEDGSINWTLVNGSSSVESTDVLQGTKSLRLTLSSQALDFKQTTTSNAVAFSDGVNGSGQLSVKTAIDNVYLCREAAGVLIANTDGTSITNCAKVPNVNKWSTVVLPIILGGTSNGLRLVSLTPSTAASLAVTGDVLVDKGVLAAGDLRQSGASCNSIECETDFSAVIVGSTCTVETTNIAGWITSTVDGGLGDCTISFVNLGLIVKPKVSANVEWTGGTMFGEVLSPTTTTVRLTNSNVAGSLTDPVRYHVTVSKQGVDFTNAKRLGNNTTYSSQNANYGPTVYTPVITAITGTLTNYTATATHQRIGNLLKISGTITFSGAVGTWSYPKIGLPSGLTPVLSSKAISIGDSSFFDTSVGSTAAAMVGADATNSAFLAATNFGTVSQAAPFALTTGDIITFDFTIPIATWENSNQIIGSFKEIPTTIGSSGVDIQSVYFGSGADCNTACSTGNCTICSQVGNKITTVSFVSAGGYNLNGIDGTKYMCTGSSAGADYDALIHERNNSTASLARMQRGTENARSATVICIGIP